VREVLGTTASVQVFPQIVPVELVAVYQRFLVFLWLRRDLQQPLPYPNAYGENGKDSQEPRA
jgi:hypothetical protein